MFHGQKCVCGFPPGVCITFVGVSQIELKMKELNELKALIPKERDLQCFYGVLGGVYLLSKVSPSFAFKHFACSISALKQFRFHTLLTSSFAHFGIFHLCLNVYASHNLLVYFRREVGPEKLWAAICGCAVGSAASAMMLQAVCARPGTPLANVSSIGFSGVIFSLFAWLAMRNPKSQVNLFFSEKLAMTSETFLLGATAVSILLFARQCFTTRPTLFAHSVHLTGIGCGVAVASIADRYGWYKKWPQTKALLKKVNPWASQKW